MERPRPYGCTSTFQQVDFVLTELGAWGRWAWLIVRRDETLQLFRPAEHDLYLPHGLRVPLYSDEALAVRRDLVAAETFEKGPLEEEPGLPHVQGRLRRHVHHHHPIAAQIEELAATGRPHRLVATFARDLLSRSRARVGLQVDLSSSRLIGDISEPPAIGREPRAPLVGAGLDQTPSSHRRLRATKSRGPGQRRHRTPYKQGASRRV